MRLIDVEHFCDCRNSFSECDVCVKAEVCDFISTQPTFNLTEHDKEVIRKFAEWLQKESIFYLDYCDWKKCIRVFDEVNPNYRVSHTESRYATLDEVLAAYEKEQK